MKLAEPIICPRHQHAAGAIVGSKPAATLGWIRVQTGRSLVATSHWELAGLQC